MKHGLDSLIETFGTNGVDKLFTEYMMLLVARSTLLDKIVAYVHENDSIDRKELEKLLAGDRDGEEESFYT